MTVVGVGVGVGIGIGVVGDGGDEYDRCDDDDLDGHPCGPRIPDAAGDGPAGADDHGMAVSA